MSKALFAFISLAVFFAPINTLAANYKIDSAHTQIMFKVRHMGIGSVNGVFKNFEGTFEYDPDKVAASKASAKIKAASIDTQNEKRDTHLRDAEFLDVKKSEEMSFVSKSVKNVNGKNFIVEGDLTIRGVTKPVELAVEFGGAAKDPWGNERAAFSASTSINRKDFGLVWNKLLETGGLVVGEDVKITIEVEGIKQ